MRRCVARVASALPEPTEQRIYQQTSAHYQSQSQESSITSDGIISKIGFLQLAIH